MSYWAAVKRVTKLFDSQMARYEKWLAGLSKDEREEFLHRVFTTLASKGLGLSMPANLFELSPKELLRCYKDAEQFDKSLDLKAQYEQNRVVIQLWQDSVTGKVWLADNEDDEEIDGAANLDI